MSTRSRLDQVYESAPRIRIGRNSRIVCMSDCHRGTGNRGDNFLFNQNVYYAALEYYYNRCFIYAELGDGDELWENLVLKRIVEIHSDVFWLLARFYAEGRLIQLFGNHDRKKGRPHFAEKHCRNCQDSRGNSGDLFSGLKVEEGVVLEDCESGGEILLVHGHQGDLLNDTLWPLAAFLVRFVWRKLELLGVYDPTSAARSYRRRKKTERRLEGWAESRNVMLIAGHTHRPALPRPGEGLYLNDGSCVHPRSITALELEGGQLTLAKWSVRAGRGRYLTVEREVLEGPYPLREYWEEKTDCTEKRTIF